eukprot:TRINITY_DN2107_c0_g1_i4.p1 TRINITY_DN2107_c0_g1~~TRINITY_DN2107_c0_g1_i4.p1  ORF type:complete len:560 (+),score=107.08 TRINITY_DN2107_c0_g1_i4:309-1988(+)
MMKPKRSLADRNNDKKLDRTEFAIALCLIRKKQKGEVLPSTLPLSLVYSAYPELAPARTEPRESNESLRSSGSHYRTIPEVLSDSTATSPLQRSAYQTMPTPELARRIAEKQTLSGSKHMRQPSDPISSSEQQTVVLSHSRSDPSKIPPKTPTAGSPWLECIHEGQIYFYNVETHEATWDRPHELAIKANTASMGTIPRPPPPQTAAEEILQDPSKVEFFKRFLDDSQLATSELQFYLEVQNFRELMTKNPQAKLSNLTFAENLYSKFLKKGSVKLPGQVLKTLEKNIKESRQGNTEHFGPSIFDDALVAILRNLEKEQLPRFMKSMVYVAMYNSMMHRRPYELPDQLWREFLVASDGGVEDGWSFVAEKKGILIHKKLFKDNQWICVRGSGVVPIPASEMYLFATSLQLREHWDNLYKSGRIVERYDNHSVVVHIEYRAPRWAPMFNPHDFCMIRTERQEADGTIIVISRSILHKDVPDRKGWNRSEVDVSGYVIRPCGNNACVVIYTNQVAIHGIPKWAEQKLANARAMTPYKIRKFVEKELKDRKKVPAWKQPDLW